MLAQCCTGGGGDGAADGDTSAIPPGLGMALVLGLSFVIYLLWNRKGASLMNRIGKITLVLGLVVAVGAVLILKKGRPPAPPTTQASSGLSRLVDLGSTTCIPCKMMAPVLEELKTEYDGRMQVVFINVSANPDAAEPFGIQLIPTQVFIDATGKERWRHEGFISKDDILAKWRELGVSFTSGSNAASQPASAPALERLQPAQADTRAKEAICYLCDKDTSARTLVTVTGDKGIVRLCSPHCYFILYSCLTEDKTGFEKKVSVTDWATGKPVCAVDAIYLYSLDGSTGRPLIKAFAEKDAADREMKMSAGTQIAWASLQEKELANRCGFCDRACYPEDSAKVIVGGLHTLGCCSHCALGVAARTGKDIEVQERDRLTGEEIVVKTVNGSVASLQPTSAVAWFGLRKGPDGKFTSAGCFHQGFFVNAENLTKWIEQNPLETGRRITIQQALADKIKLSPHQIQKACKIGECAPK